MSEEEKNVFDKANFNECVLLMFNKWNKEYGCIDCLKLENNEATEIELHTGGWSENEEIVDAICDTKFWLFYWQKSERGGHYLFKKNPENT